MRHHESPDARKGVIYILARGVIFDTQVVEKDHAPNQNVVLIRLVIDMLEGLYTVRPSSHQSPHAHDS